MDLSGIYQDINKAKDDLLETMIKDEMYLELKNDLTSSIEEIIDNTYRMIKEYGYEWEWSSCIRNYNI